MVVVIGEAVIGPQRRNLHVDGVRCGEEFCWADPRAQWRKGAS
jgi:hypothetical protein